MPESADLIIDNGTIVNATGSRPGTVVVRGGRIDAVLPAGAQLPTHERRIDASGSLVMPGGVDPHCHVGQRLGEFLMLDDYQQATTAALWGGTTTIIDFAIPEPGQRPLDALHEKHKLADSARCDVALHGGVVAWDSTTRDQLISMAQLGVLTVKMFTTYRHGVMADFETIREVMTVLGELGGMALIHAEENHVVERSLEDAAALGRTHARYHSSTRPEHAELEAVRRSIDIAETTRSAVYFVHQTTPGVVDLVSDARRRGVRAYSETCPHYFTLDDSMYDGPSPELYVCCPPLRPAAAVAALAERARAGVIDTIGSDHNCYSAGQKLKYADDARKMPNGFPGVEHRITVAFDDLVHKGGMAVEDFVSMVSTAPARLNGLATKGWIAPGADADLFVFDPNAVRTIRAADHHMASDYSPFEGREVRGWVTDVVARGRIVVDQNGFHDPGSAGRVLRAKAQLDGHRRLSLAESTDFAASCGAAEKEAARL